MARRKDMPPPATGGSERDVLVGFLDYLRESAIRKVEGAPEPQVREAGVPSGTNLLGLLNHLTAVERYTFGGQRVSNWASTFHADVAKSVDDVIDEYRSAVEQSNTAILARDDLEAPCARPARTGGEAPSMRWALAHMVEETGRHAGHMDILRELIDGATGR